MAFQIRDDHMGCEGSNGFQMLMALSLANDIAVTRWIFLFICLWLYSLVKRDTFALYRWDLNLCRHQIVCGS